MKVEVHSPGALEEPRIWVRHDQALGMALQPGSIEAGSRRSEMARMPFNAGEIFLYAMWKDGFDPMTCTTCLSSFLTPH